MGLAINAFYPISMAFAAKTVVTAIINNVFPIYFANAME